MRLSGRCCKCGSDCTPRWNRSTDRMRYSCVCGYEWSSAPLDSPKSRMDRYKEFERIMREAEKRFDSEPQGEWCGEINFQ